MTEKEKLIIALMQIESLTELLQGNEYQQFLYGHLVNINVELRRQMSFYE
jgi:hypothetical protein